MNVLPGDWSEQLKNAYPKRSGPYGWKGMRLMLAIRLALKDTDWDSIMAGVRRYAVYCEVSGKAGSEFVKAPQKFFEEGVYAEELEYQAPEDPKIKEARRLERERLIRAREAGMKFGLSPYPQESTAAFETRIKLAEVSRPIPGISGLADRMRVNK